MRIPLISLLLAAATFASSPAAAQLACPYETAGARAAVERLVSSAAFSDVRQQHALPAVPTTDVRRLTDAGDASACMRLNQFLGSVNAQADWRNRWAATFFQAGGMYYVVVVPVPLAPQPGMVALDFRASPVYVLDGQFNLRTGLAM